MDIYTEGRKRMESALGDLAILAGDRVCQGVSWSNVAGTAAANLRSLADLLDAVRTSQSHLQGCPLTGPVVFASPAEVLEDVG